MRTLRAWGEGRGPVCGCEDDAGVGTRGAEASESWRFRGACVILGVREGPFCDVAAHCLFLTIWILLVKYEKFFWNILFETLFLHSFLKDTDCPIV